MNDLLDRVKEFFAGDGWSFSEVEGKPILRLAFRGKNGNWNCYAQSLGDKNLFIFYSVCPINVPLEKRPSISELLTRANYGLPLGSFEMDYSDGEVRYRTSIDVADASLTPPLIKNLVYTNVGTFDRYLPGMMAVIYANGSPEDVIRQIEG
jgi:hypothetical protein